MCDSDGDEWAGGWSYKSNMHNWFTSRWTKTKIQQKKKGKASICTVTVNADQILPNSEKKKKKFLHTVAKAPPP